MVIQINDNTREHLIRAIESANLPDKVALRKLLVILKDSK